MNILIGVFLIIFIIFFLNLFLYKPKRYFVSYSYWEVKHKIFDTHTGEYVKSLDKQREADEYCKYLNKKEKNKND